MFRFRKEKRLAAAFDGESPFVPGTPESLSPEDQAYLQALKKLRAAAAQAPSTPVISDAQFPAFMRGIREGTGRPTPRTAGLWAMISLSAAALVLVLAMLVIFSGGPDPVRATEIESARPGMDGVTVDLQDTSGGVPTVWVNMDKDLW